MLLKQDKSKLASLALTNTLVDDPIYDIYIDVFC